MSTVPDYSAYVDEAPDSEKLSELGDLADQMSCAEQAVEKANEELSKKQEALKDLQERRIPALMDDLGVKTFTTTSGLTVEIKEQLRVSIPKDRKQKAMEWVEEHGGADLIKRLIMIAFGKNDEKWAKRVLSNLRRYKRPLPMEIVRDIPSSTVKKFLTDQLADGTEVPLELFGGYHQRQAKLSVKK